MIPGRLIPACLLERLFPAFFFMEKSLDGVEKHPANYPTVTGMRVMVSLPKMSMTLTAMV
jgi:hypothetical protein